MQKCLVSIVIPTCLGEKTLKRAIDSVLDQTYSHFEIVVIDDNFECPNERKKTEEIIKAYENEDRIKYICLEKKCNGAVARNIGVDEAKGDIIFFLDDDDYFYPNRISRCVRAMQENDSAIAFSDVEFFWENRCYNKKSVVIENDAFLETLLNDNIIGTGSNIVIRKDTFKEIGGFDEKLTRLQDFELLLNLFNSGIKPIVINEVLVRKYSYGRNIQTYDTYRNIVGYICGKYENKIDKYQGAQKKVIQQQIHKMLYKSAVYNKDRVGIKQEKAYLKGYISFEERIKELITYLPGDALIRKIYYTVKNAEMK